MSFFNRDCAKITAGRCPHCDDDKSCGHGWTLGRQEGAGRNMLCPQCHMEYNVVILDSGECAFCQEIGVASGSRLRQMYGVFD